MGMSHGRYEQRDVYVVTETGWWPKSWKWDGLESVIFIRRTTFRGPSAAGEPIVEWAHSLCSCKPTASEAAGWLQRHWAIENSCHHLLDVTFREDHHQVRDAHAAVNCSILRDTATALLKAHPGKQSLAAKRKKDGWSDDYRSALISHISHT